MLFLVPPCATIPSGQPSRTYYQVLDISPDEQDPKVIEEAALGCARQVRAYQLTCESECALRLNEIAGALITLLDPVRRQEYDRGLCKPPGSSVSERQPPAKRDAPVFSRGTLAPPTPGEGALMLLLGDGGVCDVKLVYRRCALRGAGHRTG
jgi:hypothetical protein